MTPGLADLLADPRDGGPLSLRKQVLRDGRIESGELVAADGAVYPIVRGIPRFVAPEMYETVRSFGDQWNHFNFDAFKQNWLDHTVANTFGDTSAFAGKVIVDAGGGSGAQSLWMLESGAERVILLDLSHSVDDVVSRNIDVTKWPNFDAIQCSIDAPPLRRRSIRDYVICHNVIQHTPSVEKTAEALYGIVAPGGAFVFNCYKAQTRGLMGFVRTHFVYRPVRAVLSRLPFGAILAYSKAVAALRLVPGLGYLLNKLRFCLSGRLPRVAGESWLERKRRLYRQTVLNTFDMFGSHGYQHHVNDEDILALVDRLQPDRSAVGNLERYFRKPQPTGCALIVARACQERMR
ncbi:methyltransferase domain-containing protein [Stappia sp.]|jgi:ubiquinone/menaquinone biosynthesis C-methylase UbiE|uniref:methyltransferase domain-containing protein n=1 Tax=Stappia sp. TaxID=1870903 RepID=UPI003A9A3B48